KASPVYWYVPSLPPVMPRSSCHSATAAISPPPYFGYHSNDSRATSVASSLVGAQATIVKVAAVSLTNLPAGWPHAARPLRYIAMFSASCSGGRPTVNEHSPMPRWPISSWPGRLLVAPKMGGCGCCSGFRSTPRGAPPCPDSTLGLRLVTG